MESVGQKLREARSRLGLSLEQVSAETRITLKNLSAIEADDVTRISSPFFYRSFVRQYATKVQLDYSAIEAEVHQKASSMPEPLMPGQEEVPPLRAQAIRYRRPRNLRWLNSVASFCMVMAGCSAVYAYWQNPHSNWHSLAGDISAHIKALPEGFIARASTTVKVAAPVSKAATKVVAVSEEQPQAVRVELSAVEPTWLSVVADGKEAFSGTLNTSETKVFAGSKSARIRTGNAGGLNFNFNGKDIGILGPHGQVRTVVFTKDNYEVLPSSPSVALSAFIPHAE